MKKKNISLCSQVCVKYMDFSLAYGNVIKKFVCCIFRDISFLFSFPQWILYQNIDRKSLYSQRACFCYSLMN